MCWKMDTSRTCRIVDLEDQVGDPCPRDINPDRVMKDFDYPEEVYFII